MDGLEHAGGDSGDGMFVVRRLMIPAVMMSLRC